MKEFMTIGELADFFGKSDNTIRRRAKEIGIVAENGRPLLIDKSGVERIAYHIYRNVPFAVKEAIKSTFPNSEGTPFPNGKVDNNTDDYVQRGMELVFGAIGRMEERLSSVEKKIESVPQIGYDETHMTVLGFCKVNDITCSVYDASRAGKEAARLSREEGIEIRTVPDDRFGKVNSYHKAILSRVFAL